MNSTTENRPFAKRVQSVPQSFIREILKVTTKPDMISFAGGLPNPALFPVQELAKSAARVFKKHAASALQYAATEGYYPLREFIANRYHERFNLEVSPDQVLITNGSQQALDLISKVFLDPGDKVLLERPSYLGALQCFSMYQPEFIEVKLLEDGIDIKELNQQLTKETIKLFYCIPNFQNPSGIQYSRRKREQAAHILSKHQTILIEDDPYGEITFTDEILPPMYSYLPEQTILLGSFSKTTAPGLRLGWMLANQDIITKATIMKQASDLHSGNLSQQILCDYLNTTDYKSHLDKIKITYEKQWTVMKECLNEHFPKSVSFTNAKGGMFTWLTLPEHISSRQLLEKALEHNIIFVPGDPFYACNPDKQTLRLNFSNVEEKKMRSALSVLGKLI